MCLCGSTGARGVSRYDYASTHFCFNFFFVFILVGRQAGRHTEHSVTSSSAYCWLSASHCFCIAFSSINLFCLSCRVSSFSFVVFFFPFSLLCMGVSSSLASCMYVCMSAWYFLVVLHSLILLTVCFSVVSPSLSKNINIKNKPIHMFNLSPCRKAMCMFVCVYFVQHK